MEGDGIQGILRKLSMAQEVDGRVGEVNGRGDPWVVRGGDRDGDVQLSRASGSLGSRGGCWEGKHKSVIAVDGGRAVDGDPLVDG